MRFGLLICAVFFLGVSSLAAAPLSLSEILARVENNAALQKDFEALTRKAKGKIEEVEMNRWVPTFDFKALGGVVPNATFNPNDLTDFSSGDFESDFSFSELGPFLKMELEAIQPLYTFGKITAYQEMASKGVGLANAENKKKLMMVQHMAKKAYYTYLLSAESVKSLNDVIGKLEGARDKVEELLIKNADNVTETDRLKVRVFLVDVKTRLAQAEKGLKLSRLAITELASLDSDFELDQTNLEPEKVTSLSKANVVETSMQQKPEIQQLREYISLKQAERRTVKADLFPTFFVGGKLEYAVAPGRDDVTNPYLRDDANYLNVGALLGLKQDLGVFRTINKMDTAQAEIDRLQAQLKQLEVKTRIEAERAFEEAVAAQKGIVINEDGLRAARSWLTSAGLAFNLGTASTKDLLESYAAYYKAKFDYARAVYSLNLALADLSKEAGVEVVDRLK